MRPETTFYRRLARAFERVGATLDPSVRIHRTFIEEGDPPAIATRIVATGMRRAGLILAVPDHAEISEAVTTLLFYRRLRAAALRAQAAGAAVQV